MSENNGIFTSDATCNSTTYDNVSWNNVNSKLCYYNEYYYYANNGDIYKTAKLNDTGIKIKSVNAEETDYWNKEWVKLDMENGFLFYNNLNTVYSYNVNTGVEKVVNQIAVQTGSGICGIYFDNNILYAGIKSGVDVDLMNVSQATVKKQFSSDTFVTKVKSISVSDKTLNVKVKKGKKVNNTVKLSPSVTPVYADNMGFTYSSSNQKIATVSPEGVVTGLAPGKCKITVKSSTGASKKITVTVKFGSTGTNAAGKKVYLKNGKIIKNSYVKTKKGKIFVGKDGSAANGFVTLKKNTYFFKAGKKVTGFKTVKKKTYYFDKKGIMQTGWKKIDKEKYYFKKNGIMVTGKQKIKGKSYIFDKKGRLK